MVAKSAIVAPMDTTRNRKRAEKEQLKKAYSLLLRELMEDLGIRTQKEFAKRLGFNRSTMSRHFNGQRFPDAKSLGLITSSLGISREEFHLRIQEIMERPEPTPDQATPPEDSPSDDPPSDAEDSEILLIREIEMYNEEVIAAISRYQRAKVRFYKELLSRRE